MSTDSKMRMGLDRFISKYPTLAPILACLEVQRGGTNTMAVAWDGFDIALLYSELFVDGLALEQLVGVIHHEVRHILYGHLFMKPEDYPDAEALVIAQEVTVNEHIPEPLPATPILLSAYPMLPPHEGTDERYRRLAKKKRKSKSPSGKPKASSAQGAKPIDDHSKWGEVTANEAHAKTALAGAIQDAANSAREAGDYGTLELLNDMAHAMGIEPGRIKAILRGESKTGLIHWKTLLRRYVGHELERDHSYQRAPRRFPHLLGIVPGSVRQSARASIMAAVDTSGSMSDATLNEIGVELNGLRRDHEVTLVEFDCKIQRVSRLRGTIDRMAGRGGTDFSPLFNPDFLRRHRPDVVIVFTDGYGPTPAKCPPVPVIWMLTANGAAPVDWGRAIRMESTQP